MRLKDFLMQKIGSYRSVQDVHFPPYQPVMPHPLPPSNTDFPRTIFSQGPLGDYFPSLQTIVSNPTNRRQV